MVMIATSPLVSTTVAATPSPNVDDYGGYPQPQHLQLQWPPSASVATPPPSLHFPLRSSSILMPTRSVSFFFHVFLFFAPPAPCRDDDDPPLPLALRIMNTNTS